MHYLRTHTCRGFFVPTGEGLLAFGDEDSALAAIQELYHDYPRHARAARQLAEQHFDAGRVLAKLLEHVGA